MPSNHSGQTDKTGKMNASLTHQEMNLESISLLRQKIKAFGWHRKATRKILFELMLHLIVAFGGIVIFVTSNNFLIQASGMLLSTIGSLGVSTNTHTSSHYATSERKWVNELLTYFGYPLFLGLPATYWWQKHVVLHHPTPNIMGVDQDADIMPWFALNEEQVNKTSGIMNMYYTKLQWIVFPFALALNGFSVQKDGWQYLLRQLRDPVLRKTAHWLDLVTLLLHWTVWLFIPMVFFPATAVLSFYALRIGLMGYAMYFAFAPAHYPAEAICAQSHNATADYIMRQTTTTINFKWGFICRFLCSGVDYQIEHHLFPDLSHVYYPQISHLVEQFCQKNGYPYRTLSWGTAIWKSWMVLRSPKPISTNLDVFRDSTDPVASTNT